MPTMRTGDALVEQGSATRQEVEGAAAAAHQEGRRLGEMLIAQGIVDEAAVNRAVARRHGIRSADANELLPKVDLDVARAVATRFRDHEGVLPIARVGDTLLVATTDPHIDESALLATLGASAIELCLVTQTDFRRLVGAVDLGQAGAREGARSASGGAPDLLARRAGLSAELIAFVDALLLEALSERASDIHLERYGDRVRVRLRVDGDLVDVPHWRLAADQLRGVVNVIKVRTELDIAEHRLPQGGRFSTRAGEHRYDVRVQTQPTLHGEHVVLRLLPQDQRAIGIEELGFSTLTANAYRRLLDVPAGLVLVAGPTGSGKSTTLYAGLQLLAQDTTRKVLTVEDPIEYAIENVQQSAARPDIGFAFADAMRAFVRQDPDVILVGEIRDGETGLEAIRASQTGHLVLSTLHCNDSVDAIQRLRDLGLHPNSIASELLAVFAQRLAKRNCPSCTAPAQPNAFLLAEVFPDGAPPDFACFRGAGCPRCKGRGTLGRIAVVELLPASRALRGGIARGVPVDDLRESALQAGLVPMREEALRLVQEGTIAFDELSALLPPERLRPEHRA